MEAYDEKKIGAILSWTGENLVRRYGDEEVIKFSRFSGIFRRSFKDRPASDITIAQKFFGDCMVPARVVQKGTLRAIVQPFVHGRLLEKKDLLNPHVYQQYQGIMQMHQTMIEAGHAPLDLAGALGLLRGQLDNLFLLNDGSVKIIDTLLIDVRGLGLLGKLLKPLASLVILWQNCIIHSYSMYRSR